MHQDMAAQRLDIMDAQRFDLSKRCSRCHHATSCKNLDTALFGSDNNSTESSPEPSSDPPHCAVGLPLVGVWSDYRGVMLPAALSETTISSEVSDSCPSTVGSNLASPTSSVVSDDSGPVDIRQGDVFVYDEATTTQAIAQPAPRPTLFGCLPISPPSNPFSRPTSPISRPMSALSQSVSPVSRPVSPVSRPNIHPLRCTSPSFASLNCFAAIPAFEIDLEHTYKMCVDSGRSPVEVLITTEVHTYTDGESCAPQNGTSGNTEAQAERIRRRCMEPEGRVEFN